MPAFLLLIPIAYLFPLSKNNVIISIILFPLLYKIIGVLLADSLSVDIFSDETSEAGILYLEDERKIINWKGYLGYFIQSVGLILLLYSLIRYYIVQKDVVNHACKFFIKYAYVLIYLSFLLFEQDLSSYLSPRFLHAATFPLLFSTAYYLQNTQRTFNDKIAIGLLSLHSLYNILYFMYKY